jgi:glyoxylase-like metal-dependent hydrolase (beta-lactamase superfamily II)
MSAHDEYVVTIAKYGTRQTVRSDVYLNYHLYQEPDDAIGMDYFFWIARNGERTILIDTGFSRRGGEVRSRTQLVPVPELYAKLGVDPADSPTIVLTHGHYDHVGNLDLFPTSPVVISAREYEFWTSELSNRPLFHHSVEDAETAHLVSVRAEGRLTFFAGRTELAPGIEVIEVGGHTPGQSVVSVKTSEGTVLIASDAVHYYEEYEKSMPFSSAADLVEMYTGFETIRRMVSDGEVDFLISGHDPATLGRFSPATGELAGLVSTIGILEGARS